jgi:murein DD-endopeptidase MepM/ murein hydrolase activator NlpD
MFKIQHQEKWVIMMRMENAKNFFLKTPIKFSRLTSRFSNRYHPVQHRWKAHKGTDYAAPRGTPLRPLHQEQL